MRDLYIKPKISEGWKRNPQWPAIPSTLDRCFMVWAVFEDEPTNSIVLQTAVGQNVYWGDGTQTLNGDAVEIHSYDYATINAPVILHPTGRNYKPVLVEVDVTDTNNIVLQANSTQFQNNLLEIEDRLENVAGTKNYIISLFATNLTHRCAIYVERIKLNHPMIGNSTNKFTFLTRCRIFDVPPNFFDIATSINQLFYSSFDRCDITNITATSLTGTNNLFNFRGGIRKIDTFHIQGTDAIRPFDYSGLESINVLTTDSNTMQGWFQVTTNLVKIGQINAAQCTNIQQIFQLSRIEEAHFTNCALITNTTNAFVLTGSLKILTMIGLRVGISVSGNRMQANAINDFFTSLGTADGSQTLDLRNNPGSSTCDPTIATAKGFTVLT